MWTEQDSAGLSQAAQRRIMITFDKVAVPQSFFSALAAANVRQHFIQATVAIQRRALRLSSQVKSRKKRAMLTMQLSSSITIIPPEPIIEPMDFSVS